MAITDDNNPAVECQSYVDQRADLTIVNDCYQGTSAITGKGEEYLVRYGAEDSLDYQARLKSSKFWNAFRRTVHGLVGLIFRKNPVIGEDVPAEIIAHLEDIDLQGMHFDVFAKERCNKGLTDGHSFVLVDMRQSVLADDPTANLATEKAANLRPYWVAVDKVQVIGWNVEKVSGVDTLTQVVIWEAISEKVGRFKQEVVHQFRVLTPGAWEIYRQDEKKENWTLFDEGVTSLDYIPLVPFYAQQTGFFCSTPPLLDVAHENLRHYRLQSSLDRVMDLCNVPTPVCKGRADTSAPLIVGNGVIDVPTDGDAFFLEPKGNAIATTQAEIDRCKANIASLGLLLLSSQPKVTKTATETTVEHTAETAELSAIARNLQDCIERCLMIHADYMGLESGGSVKVNQKFASLGVDPQKIQAWSMQVEKGQLTYETLWQMLVNAEELPDDFDAEKERKALGISLTQAQTIKALTDSGASIKSAAMAAGVSMELASLLQVTDEPTGVVQ